MDNERHLYSGLVQDKAEVLADVREIIAEQLGTDLDTVRICIRYY